MSKNTVGYWRGRTREKNGDFLIYEQKFDSKKMRTMAIVQDLLREADSLDQAGLSVCGALSESFPDCFRGLYHLDEMGEDSLISFENPDVRIYDSDILEKITSGENYDKKTEKGFIDYHVPLKGKEQIRKQIDYPKNNPACIIGSMNLNISEENPCDLGFFERIAGRIGFGLHHGYMLRDLTDTKNYIKKFLDALPHDTIGGLASIGINIKLVQKSVTDEKLKEMLGYSLEKSLKLRKLLLMHIENNPSEMKKHKMMGDVVNLIDIMEDSLEFYDSDMRKDSINLVRKYNVNPAETFGDKTQLGYAYRGLIGNAIRHGNKKWIEVGTEDAGNMQKTYVKNSGSGIPKDKEIFKDGIKSLDSEGLGKGLGLVQSFVKSHKGSIEVESDGKTYTQFNVFLNKL
jgi:two-component sensor histidine kinase